MDLSPSQNRPTIAAAVGGIVVAAAGVLTAATSFTGEVDAAIGILAVAVAALCGVIAQRGTYSEKTYLAAASREDGDTDDPHVPPDLLDLFESLEQADGFDR